MVGTSAKRVVASIATLVGILAIGSVAGATTGGVALRPAAATPSTRETATQATVALEDLGPGWSQFRKGSGYRKTAKKSCDVRFGPLRTSDRGYGGPMFTDTAQQAYVYSFAYVFRTEARAKAFTTARGTKRFLDCQEKADDAAAKDANEDSFVRMTETTNPAIGGPEGLEAAYVEEAGGAGDDGADVVSAQYNRFTYRQGRVVYVLLIDTGLAGDVAGSEALSARMTAALTAGSDAINARLDQLDP